MSAGSKGATVREADRGLHASFSAVRIAEESSHIYVAHNHRYLCASFVVETLGDIYPIQIVQNWYEEFRDREQE